MLVSRRVLRIALVLAAALATAAAGQDPRKPHTFRSEVVLVPLDVRVVDTDGNPITDLTADDFTITDNGVRQKVVHFSTRSRSTTSLVPRTFVIALGMGRLNEPAKGVDLAIEFVRSHLLPVDRVVILAYRRATEATTDHAAAANLLERFRTRHERVAALIERDMSRALGAPEWPLSEETRSAMNDLFDAPGLPASHSLPGGAGARGLAFHDFGMLVGAIGYARHLEGEKHLLFLSEREVNVGAGDVLARTASAARVSVSLVQTGGLRQRHPVTSARTGGKTYAYSVGPNVDQAQSIALARSLAEQTGGWVSFYESADKPLTRMVRMASFEYLLGYYPTDPPADGEYREVGITVRREGAVLLYRHGYEARPRLDEPLDARRLLAEDRILALAGRPAWSTAATGVAPPAPWARVEASAAKSPDERITVQVDVAIDPRRITFAVVGEQYTCDLDIGVFVTDAHGNGLGQHLARIEIRLNEAGYEKARRDRIREHVTVAAEGQPARVKVVLFEFDSNRASVANAGVRWPGGR